MHSLQEWCIWPHSNQEILKGMQTFWFDIWLLHLNLFSQKEEALTFQSTQKEQIPQVKCPSYHITIFVMLEKTLSPPLPYRCASQKATAVQYPPLTPLCLASSPGHSGTEVIKNTASPSVGTPRVSGLLSLWRCRLSGFPPYEVSRDKTKIRYQLVCQLSTIPSVFPDKTRLASWLLNFHKAWMILTDASKQGNVIKFEPCLIKD